MIEAKAFLVGETAMEQRGRGTAFGQPRRQGQRLDRRATNVKACDHAKNAHAVGCSLYHPVTARAWIAC